MYNEYENGGMNENVNGMGAGTESADRVDAAEPAVNTAAGEIVNVSAAEAAGSADGAAGERTERAANGEGAYGAAAGVPEGGSASKGGKVRKKKTGVRVAALCLCCAVIGGAMGVGGAYAGSRLFKDDTPTQHVSTVLEGQRESTVIDIAHVDTGKLMSAAEVYAANVNSTVGITTSITTNYWGYTTTSAASGSGFILTADGYILTNYHVVEDSSSVKVSMYDGSSYDAQIVGYDESNDIAVLKIDAQGLTPVVLGDSDDLNVGDTVVAIGNPLGELTFSLTQGAVSAKDREITLSSGVTMNLLQTDCAINSGNSGGALFNLYGEVIGITNAKYSSSGSGASVDNIGFAIPINHVRSIVESIIEKGYIAKPYIGVQVSDVSEESQRYGLPAGAAVYSVSDDSPAQAAGLQANDIITSANGQEIGGKSELVSLVQSMEPGDELTLTVYRRGETLELTVTIGEKIQSATGDSDGSQSGSDNSQSSGQQGQSQYGQGILPWGYFGN